MRPIDSDRRQVMKLRIVACVEGGFEATTSEDREPFVLLGADPDHLAESVDLTLRSELVG